MPDFDRFRSFAERYIIARSPFFRTGNEKEDAWLATQDAKTIYNNIETASKDPNVCDNAKMALASPGGNSTSSTHHPGVTGVMHAHNHMAPPQSTPPRHAPIPARPQNKPVQQRAALKDMATVSPQDFFKHVRDVFSPNRAKGVK